MAPKLAEFIGRTFQRIRLQLESRGPRQPLVVYAPDTRSFREAIAFLGGSVPKDWVVAVAFPAREVMVLSGEHLSFLPVEEYPKTIAHEIAHLVLGADRKGIPRWYHEGLAQWLSGDGINREWSAILGMLSRQDSLVSLERLARAFSDSHRLDTLFYRQSLSFIDSVTRRHGEAVHARILDGVAKGLRFPASFRRVTGETIEEIEMLWHEELAREFSWFWFIAHSIHLFQILAMVVVIGFMVQWLRRRRALRRMAAEEALDEQP
ncbi:MAG: hypothetical protein V3T77_05725 [Planctomycetota bacterium]